MGAKTRERMTEKMENASEKYRRVTEKTESGSEKYRRFRKEYPVFIYHSYQVEEAGEELKVSYFLKFRGWQNFTRHGDFLKELNIKQQTGKNF